MFRTVQKLLLLTFTVLPCLCGKEVFAGTEPFIRTTLTSRTPYAGEEMVLTYTLYFTGAAPQVSDLSNPSLGDFWYRENDPGRFVKSDPVNLNGTTYRRAVIRQYRLAGLKPGRFVIEGYRLQCIFPEPSRSRKSRAISLSAGAVTLVVRALPEPVPEEFSGGVGRFGFSLSADRLVSKTSNGVTVTATVTGTGNLSTLGIPPLRVSPSVDQSTPVTEVSLDSSNVVSTGLRTVSVTLYPKKTGTITIAPIRFVYFDPSSARYRTLTSRPITITAEKQKEAQRPLSAERTEERNPFSAIPVLIITAVLLAMLMTARFVSGRKRLGGKPEKTGNRARTAAENDTPEAIRKTLYGLIEKKGIRKPESLTREQLLTAMRKEQISSEVRTELAALLQAIDQALYSPSPLERKELELIRRAGMHVIEKLHRS